MSVENLACIENNPDSKPVGSVIWLHGLGADGNDFAALVPELQITDDLPLRFVFPHAPIRPITLNGGMHMRGWYDIYGLDLMRGEDEQGITASALRVENLIAHEIAQGIPAERIVLGGFSQGGAVVLHTGLRLPQKIAGILALSTYVPLAQKISQEINSANQATPIFLAHGLMDGIIPIQAAHLSHSMLSGLNLNVELHTYPMAHSVCAEEIVDIANWLKKIFHPAIPL